MNPVSTAHTIAMSAPIPNDLGWKNDHDKEQWFIRLAHQRRLELTPPSQSNFRVIAIIFYEVEDEPNNHWDDATQQTATTATTVDAALHEASSSSSTSRHYVIGTNDEPGGNVGGSICAERSAMLQLRFIPKLRRITKLLISTDALHPIAPGMMCREFLTGNPKVIRDLPIILVGSVCQDCSLNISFPQEHGLSSEQALAPLQASCGCSSIDQNDGDMNNNESFKFHSFKVLRTTLKQLYPYPSLYARSTAHEAARFGGALERNKNAAMAKARPPKTESGMSVAAADDHAPLLLIEYATRAARRQHERDRVERPGFLHHPITYGAAVLFDNGTMAAASQKKTLEYGCTLDAVCQLAHIMDDDDDDDDHDDLLPKLPTPEPPPQTLTKRKPVLLVHVDQYGFVHAPFAPARAFLSEHGYGQCRVILQTMLDPLSLPLDLQSKLESMEQPTADLYAQVPACDLAPLAPNNSCHT